MAYLYSIDKDGQLLIREGDILLSRSITKYKLFLVKDSGQRILISNHAGEIHNNMMWSEEKGRITWFYERLMDILLDREQKTQDSINSIRNRRRKLRESYEKIWKGD